MKTVIPPTIASAPPISAVRLRNAHAPSSVCRYSSSPIDDRTAAYVRPSAGSVHVLGSVASAGPPPWVIRSSAVQPVVDCWNAIGRPWLLLVVSVIRPDVIAEPEIPAEGE